MLNTDAKDHHVRYSLKQIKPVIDKLEDEISSVENESGVTDSDRFDEVEDNGDDG